MLKKAGPFKYKKLKALPADSDITNTRFYLFTDHGSYWCPPFKEMWQTFPEEMTDCLEVLVVYVVRVDLGIAARCHLDAPVDLDIGENIGFRFDVPLLSWRQPDHSKGSSSNTSLCRSSGQHRPKLRIVYGQDGKLEVSGMAGINRASNGSQLRHKLVKLQRDSHPTGKSLPTRPKDDKDADSGD